MRVLFFNIAWMEKYQGNTGGNDKPKNGGAYVDQTGDAHEKYNFAPVDMEDPETGELDSYCLGFYETKSHNGEDVNQMHIEKIEGCSECRDDEQVEDVLVVYCAKHWCYSFTTVVGWYKHATVFRNYQSHDFGNGDIQLYNAIAKAQDCVLLPTGVRSRQILWEVPRKGKRWAFGFGRANVWYAGEDNPKLKEYLKRIINQIENYSGENLMDK